MSSTGHSRCQPADRTWSSEPALTRDQVAVLTTEVRTLRERLIVSRAREAALEQKVRRQARDVEKNLSTLASLTEDLRKNQNLTLSYPHHVGEVLVQLGRGLLEKFAQSDAAGRIKLWLRISEFLEFEAILSKVAFSHPDWPHVWAELSEIRGQHWCRHVLSRAPLRRTLGRLLRRLNPLAG